VPTGRWLRGGHCSQASVDPRGRGQANKQKSSSPHSHSFVRVDIQDDVNLSYSWRQLRSLEIHPREHGILCVSEEQSVWVSLGVQENDCSNNTSGVQTTKLQKPKKAYYRFRGIGSATKVLTEWGFEVASWK